MRTISLKLTALSAAMLIGCAMAGGPDAGNFTVQYAKNSPVPVDDQRDHIIYPGEAQGTAESSTADGSKVLNRDYVGIINGSGTHQGYATFAKESVKWAGKVKTTMNKDGTPNTTFRGNWTTVHGTGEFEQDPGAGGTYNFTSPTDYVVEWREE